MSRVPGRAGRYRSIGPPSASWTRVTSAPTSAERTWPATCAAVRPAENALFGSTFTSIWGVALTRSDLTLARSGLAWSAVTTASVAVVTAAGSDPLTMIDRLFELKPAGLVHGDVVAVRLERAPAPRRPWSCTRRDRRRWPAGRPSWRCWRARPESAAESVDVPVSPCPGTVVWTSCTFGSAAGSSRPASPSRARPARPRRPAARCSPAGPSRSPSR